MSVARLARLDGAGWSNRCIEPTHTLRCDPPTFRSILCGCDGIEKSWDDPLEALRWLESDAHCRDWIGFLNYDLGRWFETIPSQARDDLELPLFAFACAVPLSPDLGGEDQGEGPSTASDGTINVPAPPAPLPRGRGRGSRFVSREQYLCDVQRCLEYIAAGDVFQVNLSQRLSVEIQEPAAVIYQRLQSQTPAVYGAYLDFGDFQILSNSPELFLEVDSGRNVTTRPIKGTRAVATSTSRELRDSEKDAAELNMIIDLERNDLGRVCERGSVRVSQPREIETHPTVHHGVATIEGRLREDVGLVELLAATFPGGSVTGAPKIRAMEIIDELEPLRRGPYCGAIGILRTDGSITLNVAIRTMVIQNQQAYFSVGGGIVADSDSASEYDETLVKAEAMLRALNATLQE